MSDNRPFNQPFFFSDVVWSLLKCCSAPQEKTTWLVCFKKFRDMWRHISVGRYLVQQLVLRSSSFCFSPVAAFFSKPNLFNFFLSKSCVLFNGLILVWKPKNKTLLFRSVTIVLFNFSNEGYFVSEIWVKIFGFQTGSGPTTFKARRWRGWPTACRTSTGIRNTFSKDVGEWQHCPC